MQGELPPRQKISLRPARVGEVTNQLESERMRRSSTLLKLMTDNADH